MAPPDRSPRLSEGGSTVRTMEDVILHINTIREQLQQTILRNQKTLERANARRNGENGKAQPAFGGRNVTLIT